MSFSNLLIPAGGIGWHEGDDPRCADLRCGAQPSGERTNA
jgi:hypothetical protein